MMQAQEWSNEHYPKEIRKEVKNLYARGKGLKGHLDLKDFTNLEKLDCSYNQLTSLDLTGLKKLRTVYANDNLLNKLDYFSLNPEKLTSLIINNNDLPEQNIEIFSQFAHLEDLRIGSTDEKKIKEGFYNRFFGSLESLKKMTSLIDLDISNADIDKGVDDLPSGIRRIQYSAKERSESRVKKLAERLSSFLDLQVERESSKDWESIHSNFDKWKKREWKDLGFDFQEVRKWIESGLQPDDYHFAAWLRWKKYKPEQNLNWEELRKETRDAQGWLNNEYSSSKRKWVNWLDVTRRSGLEGDLVIKNLPNLERLDCYHNQISSLSLNNLPKLTRISCPNNKIAKLTINNCPEISNLNFTDNSLVSLNFLDSLDPNKLIFLYITNNSFSEQDISVFSKFVNLKALYLANNSFYGDLQSFKNLKKLEKLGVSGTKISGGLEYLPDSLNEFASDLEENDISGSKIIRWSGVLSKNKESLMVPYHDFQYWKESWPAFQNLKEHWKKVNPSLDIRECLRQWDIFFNVKTGIFEGNTETLITFLQQNGLISEKDNQIDLLKILIEQLKCSRKDLMQKITNAYLTFPSEKEKLRELIKARLELTGLQKAKENDEFTINKYAEQLYEMYRDLAEKSPSIIGKIDDILVDCSELVNKEFELQSKLNVKMKIDYNNKQVKNITHVDASTNIARKHTIIDNHAFGDVSYLQKQISNGENSAASLLAVYQKQTRESVERIANSLATQKVQPSREQKTKPQLNDLNLLVENFKQLSSLKGSIDKFFKNWNNLFTQKELENIRKQIEKVLYAKVASKLSVIGGGALAAVGGYYDRPDYLLVGGSIAAGGTLADIIFSEWEKSLERRYTESREKQGRLKQDIKELKSDYWQLIELWEELSNDSNETPSASEELNKAFSEFVEIIRNLKQKIALSNDLSDQQLLEQVQLLQNNWQTRQINQIITNLEQEGINYRQCQMSKVEEQIRQTEVENRNQTQLIKDNLVGDFLPPFDDSNSSELKSNFSSKKQLDGSEEGEYIVLDVIDRTARGLEEGNKQLKTEQNQLMSPEGTQSWTNIHPFFTSQLIQAWQNHNFTSRQTRDWINIHSPTDQNQAIQEPEYYAWLRDVKQVDAEWVLNYGNEEDLRKEYQKSQPQAQSQVLQAQKFSYGTFLDSHQN